MPDISAIIMCSPHEAGLPVRPNARFARVWRAGRRPADKINADGKVPVLVDPLDGAEVAVGDSDLSIGCAELETVVDGKLKILGFRTFPLLGVDFLGRCTQN
jgi:hypothetical protein